MEAVALPVAAEPQPYQNVAAEPFDQGDAFGGLADARQWGADRTRGQALEYLPDQVQALLDLADANPHARIHISLLAHRHCEFQSVIRRIAGAAARVEGPAGSPADIASCAKAPRELRPQHPGADGAVLQRRGVVVERDQWREAPLRFIEKRANGGHAGRREIDRPPAPHDAVPPQARAQNRIGGPQTAPAQHGAGG